MKIDSFTGEHRFLSNFYIPAPVSLNGVIYPSVEHAYQASKSDNELVRFQFTYGTPGDAKRLGRIIKLRKNWELDKEAVMFGLLRKKFLIPNLKQKLLDTGDAELIEGNTWGDTYWGVCNGIGQNRLGVLLMKVRSELSGLVEPI
jgi:ribA/ribD-fused uncharacterized protein